MHAVESGDVFLARGYEIGADHVLAFRAQVGRIDLVFVMAKELLFEADQLAQEACDHGSRSGAEHGDGGHPPGTARVVRSSAAEPNADGKHRDGSLMFAADSQPLGDVRVLWNDFENAAIGIREDNFVSQQIIHRTQIRAGEHLKRFWFVVQFRGAKKSGHGVPLEGDDCRTEWLLLSNTQATPFDKTRSKTERRGVMRLSRPKGPS